MIMARWSKAQVAMEFMFVVVILLFLTAAIILASGQKISEFSREKDYILLKDVVAGVRNELQIAHAMDSGYVRNFDVPVALEGQDYTITIENSFISASMGDAQLETAIQPVNGSLQKGTNVVRKVGGNVSLN